MLLAKDLRRPGVGFAVRSLPLLSVLSFLLMHFLYGCTTDGPLGVSTEAHEWAEVGFPLNAGYPECVSVAPDGTIYVGTSSEFRHDHESVLLSLDGGGSWEMTGLIGYHIVQVEGDGEGNIFALANTGRFFRKVAGSGSWEQCVDGLEDMGKTLDRAVAFHPCGDLYYRVSGHGVGKLFRSRDLGGSWEVVANLPDSVEVVNAAIAGDGRIFVAGMRGLWRTSEPDTGWSKILSYPESGVVGLGIDSAGRVFIGYSGGGGDFLRSEDDGGTWVSLKEKFPSYYSSPRTILFDGMDNIYIKGKYESIMWSGDGGESWEWVRSSSGKRSFTVAASGEIFLVSSKLYRTENLGESWEVIGLDSYCIVAMDEDDAGRIYALTSAGTIYRTDETRSTWGVFDTGMVITYGNCMLVDGETVFVGGNGLFMSQISGPSWERIFYSESSVCSIVSEGDSMVVGTRDGVFVSVDAGNTWRKIGLDSYPVEAVVITRNGSILAGTARSGVFMYTGKEDVWEQMCDGLGELGVVSMVVDGSGDVYAATRDAVYRLDRVDLSWVDTGVRLVGDGVLTKTRSGRAVVADREGNVFILRGRVWHRFPLEPGREHYVRSILGGDNGLLYLYDYYGGIQRSREAVFD